MTSKFLTQVGYKISYYLYGNSNLPTIVFLHPAFSDNSCFYHQIEFFSQQFHVITIDLLRHGKSAIGKSNDKIDKSAFHIQQILTQENIKSAHIVGVSMGSLIAQHFALLYPQQTLSVTALGGYNINEINNEVAKSQRKEMLSWITRIIFSMNSFRRYAANVSCITSEGRDIFYNSAMGFKRKSLTAMAGLGKLIENRANFKRQYPLLILEGEYDNALAIKMAKQWYASDADSIFYVIENAGHCAMLDNAAVFNATLLNFIKKYN